MPTKISRYCEGVMEAAWLAALVVVPVFFNIYSSRIFEPDKLTLLRSLALVILGAWMIKLIEEGIPRSPEKPLWAAIWKTPLIPQVTLLGAVYLLATAFSVTPRISLWGSYQRLQGTYTTLSYLIIFAAIVGNLRRRSQIERLFTTAILASLPIGLYGILQRYQLDPVPWGGNVTRRIAANMGNSIFVAAYLIMVFPITVGRIVDSFSAILSEETNPAAHVARGTVYVFTASIQLIAIYMSGSRGPMLGLLAGSFFLLVILSLYWGKRRLTIGVVGLAGTMALFLVMLNIPNGPLESIRSAPWMGRFGRLLDTEQNTSQVRILIWQGASEMVLPHEPLEFPDGSQDAWNFLRPIIGYGPESMYVAYNPFYPPALAQHESRNASPDRSHNETWDSVVITGLLGLGVYLALFTSIFYYGLKWLGLIGSSRQRNLFLALFLGGGAISAAGFVYFGGIEFFGVGLPFGMMIGLVAYLPLVALFSKYQQPVSEGDKVRALTLIMLLSAIVAHFVEIHFGIAIAATRTYFWTYTGMMLVVGYVMTSQGAFENLVPVAAQKNLSKKEARANQKSSRKKHRRAARRPGPGKQTGSPAWSRFIVPGLITAIILITLGYDFITNPNQSNSTLKVIWTALTQLPNKDFAVSYGILTMFTVLWIAAGVTFLTEGMKLNPTLSWKQGLLIILGLSAGVGVLFWLAHASSLAGALQVPPGGDPIEAQVRKLEGLLTRYYVFLLIILFVLARFLPDQWPVRSANITAKGMVAAPLILIAVLLAVNVTNLRVIRADITFKVAEPFARGKNPQQWQTAIALYQRAIRLAPSEDHYYLFLGRAYLELARLLQTDKPQSSEQLMVQANDDLKRAQAINPLNTDHTANLARLYRFWSGLATNPETRLSRVQTSSEYYSRAVTLSPHNAGLWNEWGILLLSLLDDSQKGLEVLDRSLEIDPNFDTTHAILGDYYAQQARKLEEATAKKAAFDQAIDHYEKAFALTKDNRTGKKAKFNFLAAEASLYTDMKDYETAIEKYLASLEFAANNQRWQVHDTIARLYYQTGDSGNALTYARLALQEAPEDQKSRVQQLVEYLQQNP